MDDLLQDWQSRRLPRTRPLADPGWPARRPHRHPRRPLRLRRRMERSVDDLVVIEAGPVTILGDQEQIDRLASAAGVYAPEPDGRPMSKDEDPIMTGVYVGVGLLLAAGAGYLAWRFLLDDAQKQRVVNTTKDLVADGVTKGRRAVRDARGKVHL